MYAAILPGQTSQGHSHTCTVFRQVFQVSVPLLAGDALMVDNRSWRRFRHSNDLERAVAASLAGDREGAGLYPPEFPFFSDIISSICGLYTSLTVHARNADSCCGPSCSETCLSCGVVTQLITACGSVMSQSHMSDFISKCT